MENIKLRLCGKRIISIEPSQWSGEVRALTNTQGFVSITLDDGTILEVGGLFIREFPERQS